ncbi:hypothetical protein C2G38_2186162 [Gigaspora rosea]|uniref:Uncharacterized protein n=1 Tax=Gigaspora rosea TaxID=44941 RepID=A0A397VEW9_9GLOM|nr:hypothetical protein C2G38_2186162 [Gigaspora rosea]
MSVGEYGAFEEYIYFITYGHCHLIYLSCALLNIQNVIFERGNQINTGTNTVSIKSPRSCSKDSFHSKFGSKAPMLMADQNEKKVKNRTTLI